MSGVRCHNALTWRRIGSPSKCIGYDANGLSWCTVTMRPYIDVGVHIAGLVRRRDDREQERDADRREQRLQRQRAARPTQRDEQYPRCRGRRRSTQAALGRSDRRHREQQRGDAHGRGRRARRRRALVPTGSARASAALLTRVGSDINTYLARPQRRASMLGGTRHRERRRNRPPRSGRAARGPRRRSTATTSTRVGSVPLGQRAWAGRRVLDPLGRHPVGPGDRDEIDRLGRGEQHLELRQVVLGQVRRRCRRRRCRRRRTCAGGRAAGACAEQPVRVVEEAEIAAQRDHRARRARPATPTTVETKPSMPFAPRFASTRTPDRGAMHHSSARTGRLDATTSAPPVGNRGRDIARDARLAGDVVVEHRDRARRRARRSASARPRPRSGRRPIRSDVGRQRASSNAIGIGPHPFDRGCAAGRARRRRDRRARSATAVEPRVRDLARERRADAGRTRSGRCAAANASTRSNAS